MKYYYQIVDAQGRVTCDTSKHDGYQPSDAEQKEQARGRMHLLKFDMTATHTVHLISI